MRVVSQFESRVHHSPNRVTIVPIADSTAISIHFMAAKSLVRALVDIGLEKLGKDGNVFRSNFKQSFLQIFDLRRIAGDEPHGEV